MSKEKTVCWTLNAALGRFLFEPGMQLNLSINNPYFHMPKDLPESTEAAFRAFLDRAVTDRVLLEGEVKLDVAKPQKPGVSVDPEKILVRNLDILKLKAAISEICSRPPTAIAHLPDGSVMSALSDLEALLHHEENAMKRPDVISMLKRALSGENGRFKGGISSVDETEKRPAGGPAVAEAAAAMMGGDPFGE